MANQEHLKILNRGVEYWNQWRKDNPDVRPDLRGANLTMENDATNGDVPMKPDSLTYIPEFISETDFNEENFSETNLSPGNYILERGFIYGKNSKDPMEAVFFWNILNERDFSEVNFSGVDLSGANLSGANLSKANLNGANLRGAILRKTNLVKAQVEGTNFLNAKWGGGNGEHIVELLKAISEERMIGVYKWKTWRKKNQVIEPDLRMANLKGANLSMFDLSGSKLIGVNLSAANLSGLNLSGLNLSGTNLSGANLSGTNFNRAILNNVDLSGAIIDEFTVFRRVEGCRTGINGFYCRSTDSAALMKLSPPGDSMQGADPNAIIENLKRARRLHGSSMLLAVSVLILAVLGLEEIKFSTVDIGKISPANFVLLAMPISLGFLVLVRSFMDSALNGIIYLSDRNSAMIVGNFPWALSKYERGPTIRFPISLLFRIFSKFSSFGNRIFSFLTRLVMCFHPLVYVYYWGRWEEINMVFFVSCFILLMVLSLWIFSISQQFQKPILFDTRTEENRKSDMARLTEKVDELIELLKPENDESAEGKGGTNRYNGFNRIWASAMMLGAEVFLFFLGRKKNQKRLAK